MEANPERFAITFALWDSHAGFVSAFISMKLPWSAQRSHAAWTAE